MKVFRKYKFGSKGAFTTKLNALGIDEEGNHTHPHLIQELGYEPLTPAEYDEEGNVTVEATYSTNYLVDVLWDGAASADWNNQVVWTKPYGMLVMGASEVRREWVEQCKLNRPELFPEPIEEEL